MAEFRFVTIWRIEAPIHEVYDAICRSLHWPKWWKGVEQVVELEPGDERGIGRAHRYTWKSRLPYCLTFDIRVIHVEPPLSIEGVASGEVQGIGRWHLSGEGPVTTVRYEWQVRTTRLWMNLVAPVARPLFKWNHDAVMHEGGVGLARLLNARLLGVAHS